jgi:hypothetical protein
VLAGQLVAAVREAVERMTPGAGDCGVDPRWQARARTCVRCRLPFRSRWSRHRIGEACVPAFDGVTCSGSRCVPMAFGRRLLPSPWARVSRQDQNTSRWQRNHRSDGCRIKRRRRRRQADTVLGRRHHDRMDRLVPGDGCADVGRGDGDRAGCHAAGIDGYSAAWRHRLAPRSPKKMSVLISSTVRQPV